jgi:hypothetical protein
MIGGGRRLGCSRRWGLWCWSCTPEDKVVSWWSCVRTKGMEEGQCGSERSKVAAAELLTMVAGEGDFRRTAALGREGASGVAFGNLTL